MNYNEAIFNIADSTTIDKIDKQDGNLTYNTTLNSFYFDIDSKRVKVTDIKVINNSSSNISNTNNRYEHNKAVIGNEDPIEDTLYIFMQSQDILLYHETKWLYVAGYHNNFYDMSIIKPNAILVDGKNDISINNVTIGSLICDSKNNIGVITNVDINDNKIFVKLIINKTIREALISKSTFSDLNDIIDLSLYKIGDVLKYIGTTVKEYTSTFNKENGLEFIRIDNDISFDINGTSVAYYRLIFKLNNASYIVNPKDKVYIKNISDSNYTSLIITDVKKQQGENNIDTFEVLIKQSDYPSTISAETDNITDYKYEQKITLNPGDRIIKLENGWDKFSTLMSIDDYRSLIIMDETPKSGSNNPVTSNGIYNALNKKLDKSDYPFQSPSGENVLWLDGTLKVNSPAVEVATKDDISGIEDRVDKLEHSSGGGSSVTVEDNLISTSSTNALSANMGRYLNDQVKDKANKTEILSKTNTDIYTPTNDYNPATKKYVDDKIGSGSSTTCEEAALIEYYGTKDITMSPTNYFEVTGDTITGLTDVGKSVSDTLVVPYKINDIKITKIQEQAFKEAAATKIILPDTIDTIGNEAFRDSALNSIRLSKSTETLLYGLFINTPLTKINIPEGIKILHGTFTGATKLQYVKLPNSLTTIEMFTFQTNPELIRVDIPMSVTTIDDRAFNDTPTPESLHIWCDQNSIAYEYANNHSIPVYYESIDPSTFTDKNTFNSKIEEINTKIINNSNPFIFNLSYGGVHVITESCDYIPSKSGSYTIICVGSGGQANIENKGRNSIYFGGSGGIAIKTLDLEKGTRYPIYIYNKDTDENKDANFITTNLTPIINDKYYRMDSTCSTKFNNTIIAYDGCNSRGQANYMWRTMAGGYAEGGDYNYYGINGDFIDLLDIIAGIPTKKSPDVGIYLPGLMEKKFNFYGIAGESNGYAFAESGYGILGHGAGQGCSGYGMSYQSSSGTFRVMDKVYTTGYEGAVIIIPNG